MFPLGEEKERRLGSCLDVVHCTKSVFVRTKKICEKGGIAYVLSNSLMMTLNLARNEV